MVRYTQEQKEEAMKCIDTLGVKKTHEQLGISVQTLYKWKNEAQIDDQYIEDQYIELQPSKAQPIEEQPLKNKPIKESVSTDVLELVKDDGYLSQKIRELEGENAMLREKNEKLRKALLAFLS